MATVSIGRAGREAATDFYFNSLRFVPANVAWAAAVLAALFLATLWPPAALLLVLAAAPLAGIHRLAALVARGEPVSLSDFVDGVRRLGMRATAVAAGAGVVGLVLATNLLSGFSGDGPLTWFVGATALWGLVVLAMALVAFWPVLADPHREGASLRRQLQLAGLVVIGQPVRLLALTLVIAGVTVASTVLLGAIVLFGIAYASLLATRWVLPAADELEARYEAARAAR